MVAPSAAIDVRPLWLNALLTAGAYPHDAIAGVQLVETHISWVLLAGDFAYKIKKPVNLGFLDFSTLSLRLNACREELRLNRRQAENLYLGIDSILADRKGSFRMAPGIVEGASEYAVRLRRFPQSAQLDRQLVDGTLTLADMEEIAHGLAHFHEVVETADAARAAVGEIRQAALENLTPLRGVVGPEAIASLQEWTMSSFEALENVFRARLAAGFVRECHGDLHLSNLVRLDEGITAFDCIEFSPALRWIDVQSEIAFLAMDLLERRRPDLAWRFINAYLAQTGDYGGIQVLRFYLVYRSLVRAKVAAIRLGQGGIDTAEQRSCAGRLRSHMALALELTQTESPGLIITCGLSGSGKSRLAGQLADSIPAVLIRSDVERKRTTSTPSMPRYSREAIAANYERLFALARTVIEAGYPVILDATFLRKELRARACMLASEHGVGFCILYCHAPPRTLLQRVGKREREGADASEAGPAVLARQRRAAEFPMDKELQFTLPVDTSATVDVAALGKRLAHTPGTPRTCQATQPATLTHSPQTKP